MSGLTLCNPWTIQSIESSRPGHWSGQPFSSPRGLPNLEIKPRSPALRGDSLPTEPQGKPKNIGMGSLSLLQRIFPSQESNRGLLHCRQILYQLGYPCSFSPYTHTYTHTHTCTQYFISDKTLKISAKNSIANF